MWCTDDFEGVAYSEYMGAVEQGTLPTVASPEILAEVKAALQADRDAKESK